MKYKVRFDIDSWKTQRDLIKFLDKISSKYIILYEETKNGNPHWQGAAECNISRKTIERRLKKNEKFLGYGNKSYSMPQCDYDDGYLRYICKGDGIGKYLKPEETELKGFTLDDVNKYNKLFWKQNQIIKNRVSPNSHENVIKQIQKFELYDENKTYNVWELRRIIIKFYYFKVKIIPNKYKLEGLVNWFLLKQLHNTSGDEFKLNNLLIDDIIEGIINYQN